MGLLWKVELALFYLFFVEQGGGPRVVVSTAAFHARVRGSVSGLGSLKETKNFPPHARVKVSIVGSLRDREVACSASDRQGSNFEFCVWRAVSSQSSHHPQEVLLAQFSLYVHKGGLNPDSFHFFVEQTTHGRILKSVMFRANIIEGKLTCIKVEAVRFNGKHWAKITFCAPAKKYFWPLKIAKVLYPFS